MPYTWSVKTLTVPLASNLNSAGQRDFESGKFRFSLFNWYRKHVRMVWQTQMSPEGFPVCLDFILCSCLCVTEFESAVGVLLCLVGFLIT